MEYHYQATLKISDDAYALIKKRAGFYLSKSRLPRVVLTQISCSGAKFDLFFDHPRQDDVHLPWHDLEILTQPEMLERFGGFELDVENFFFTRRINIQPLKNSRACDCNVKCKAHKEEQ